MSTFPEENRKEAISEDARKLGESVKRIASAAVGIAWKDRVGYHMAALLASNTCCAFLIYMNIAYTSEIEMMIFVGVSSAMKQYYDNYLPREVPAFNPPFKFMRKEVIVP